MAVFGSRERRLEYTVIGDTVNTASRIEGIAKDTPYQLFLADSTRRLLRAEPEGLIDLGKFDVRGRAAKTRLGTHSDERIRKHDRAPGDEAEPAMSD